MVPTERSCKYQFSIMQLILTGIPVGGLSSGAKMKRGAKNEALFLPKGRAPPTESKGVLGRAQDATAAPGLQGKDVLVRGFGNARIH